MFGCRCQIDVVHYLTLSLHGAALSCLHKEIQYVVHSHAYMARKSNCPEVNPTLFKHDIKVIYHMK